MNLKNKIALSLSLLFSLLLGSTFIVIYLFFAEFRKDEFVEILKDRITTVSNYFSDVPGDEGFQEPVQISGTPTYSIQQEEILVFNKKFQLIYSSIRNMEVDWSSSDLVTLKAAGSIYRSENRTEIYGERIGGRYFLIESEDVLGKEKLEYLRSLMLITFFVASGLVWLLSFLFAKKMIAPLDIFQRKITRISGSNLTERLPETSRKDEINLLAIAFNTMLRRLDKAFSSQKEFTASASHEIKTPLTRIAFQLENLKPLAQKDAETAHYLQTISDEVYRLSDTVHSLLLLSTLEDETLHQEIAAVRIDEVIFDAFSVVKKNFSDFQLEFNIGDKTTELSVAGVKPLLEVVFINLFKNAFLYSTDRRADVVISENGKHLSITVSSKGKTLGKEETEKIFEAFRRGENARSKSGSGLGLRICKRILDFHQAKFIYEAALPEVNRFSIDFPVFRS